MDKVSLRLEVLKLTYRKDQNAEFNIGVAREMEKYVSEKDEPIKEELPASNKIGKNQKNTGNPDILS